MVIWFSNSRNTQYDISSDITCSSISLKWVQDELRGINEKQKITTRRIHRS